MLSGYLPQTMAREGEPPVVTTVGMVDALATGCVLASVSRVDVGGCVGAGGGILFARSAHVSRPGAGVGWRPEAQDDPSDGGRLDLAQYIACGTRAPRAI